MRNKLIKIKNLIGKNKFVKKIYKKNQGRAAIICYHRVTNDEVNDKYLRPNGDLSITKTNFEKQIIFLKNNFKIVSMDDILGDINNEFKVAITFDDGYLDNHTNALPILTKHNVPATVYITSGFIQREVFAWWIELWNLIIQKDNILLNYKNFHFDENISTFEKKKNLYFKISKYFKSIPYYEQKKVFLELSNNKFEPKFNKLFLNEEQLILLAKSNLITIGAHTHTHPNLKILSDDKCVKEIKSSKEFLEKILKKKVNHFAYPYGAEGFFSFREQDIVKNLGFSTAVTTLTGQLIEKYSFSLPRIGLNDSHTNNDIQDKLSGWDNLIKKFLN